MLGCWPHQVSVLMVSCPKPDPWSSVWAWMWQHLLFVLSKWSIILLKTKQTAKTDLTFQNCWNCNNFLVNCHFWKSKSYKNILYFEIGQVYYLNFLMTIRKTKNFYFAHSLFNFCCLLNETSAHNFKALAKILYRSLWFAHVPPHAKCLQHTSARIRACSLQMS